jgi:DNA-binding beta-propeller fold protein YncE
MRIEGPLACVLVATSCTASSLEVLPPVDQLYSPTALAVSPDESVLFVTDANSELRYNSGSISVFDLARVDQAVAAWVGSDHVVPPGCSQDSDHSETLVCDEAQFMITEASVRIGNFASDMAVQDRGSGLARLIVPTRGDPSVEWIDWDGSTLSCTSARAPFDICDDAHRLASVHGAGDLPVEPFDAFVDSRGQFAIVTHFSSGSVTLIDSPASGDATIADVATGLFVPDLNGFVGTTGVAGRMSSDGGDIVYVASQYEDRIQTLTVGRPVNNAPAYLLPGSYFFLDGVGGYAGASSDSRGLVFSRDGNRLFDLNRSPPSLQVFDTSQSPTGGPRNTLMAAVDICRNASRFVLADGGDGERVYLTCFQDGEVDVIDPRGQSSLQDVIISGRGPYSIAQAPARKKLYVTNFLEDTVAVIDADVKSATFDRVVLRLGEPKPP